MTDPVPTTPKPTPAENVTFAQLQTRALELFKNPAVLAGGAIVLGIVVARLTAGQKLRETAVRKVADLVKDKAAATFFPNASVPPVTSPPPPAPAAATSSTPTVPWMTAGRQILDTLAPNLGEQLKKRLAEILPNPHN
jgi:hypothetical protein